MYFATTLVASLLLSANALVTPHVGDSLHRRHQHAALVRRAITPESPAPPMEASAAIPKRQLKKRCKPRRTSSGLSATSSAATSAALLPSGKPANVAAPVPSPTTNHDAPSSSAPPPAPSPPKPSSSAAPAPKPSPSSSPAPAPAPSSGSGGGQSNSLFSGTQTGADGTFYMTGLGACGITNNDGDLIAAVSEDLFDHFPGYNGVNPNSNPVCNKKVTATFQGKSVTVTITDRCTGCQPKDLDFSPTAFNMLSDPSVGRIHGMVWTWDD